MQHLKTTFSAIAIAGAAAVSIMLAVNPVSATEVTTTPTAPPAEGTTAPTVPSAAAAAAPDAETQDEDKKEKFHVECKKGKGSNANFSWVEGTVNTRVYYNNHCSHAVKVTVHTTDLDGNHSTCWKVKANKKSSKEFQQGMSGKFKGLSKGCKFSSSEA